MELKENEISTKALKLITSPKTEFFIPSYQRGYRWDTTQVTDLLDDLFQFMEEKQEKYCLQPVVVKKRPDGKWEVIDGQQRLTTIFIILSRLKKSTSSINPFKIEYETRTESKFFLENLKYEIDDTNIDFYHISNAYKVISDWIDDKINNHFEVSIEADLFSNLMNKVEIIWFQINDNTNPREIFTRINIGKIPLTSSELIKAIFLSQSNLDLSENKDDKNDIYQKQLEISGEWDRMEYELQDDNFWSFINKAYSNSPTRIDFVLNLVARAERLHKEDQNATFRHFYSKITDLKKNKSHLDKLKLENKSIIDEDWSKIKECFSTLKEWYLDHNYYHLIGYLIYCNLNIKDILDKYEKSNKKDFLKYLTEQIGITLNGIEIKGLQYGKSSDNSKLIRILSLFNILSTLNINDINIRFPFNKLKDKDTIWSLEHIHAQNSQGLKKSQFYNWLKDHKAALERLSSDAHTETIKQISLILKMADEKKDKSIDEIEFEKLFVKVIDIFKKDNDVETEIHDISNMALLDKDSNSSLSNSIFEVKRNNILNKEKEGRYIPVATRNVFLKYYTEYPEHLNYWTQEDRDAYVLKIKTVLQPYLKEKENVKN